MWAHLTDVSASSSPPGLLPTPDAYAGSRGGSQDPAKRREGGHSVSLQDVVEHLLPTPTARDWKDGVHTPNVEVNGLLGRTVWSIGASTPQPSTDGNAS